MFLKAAVNGGRTRSEAPTVPLTPEEIALEAAKSVALGAAVVHAHARTADGGQSIHPDDVAAMVRAVRAADPSIIIGTTTGLWTCSGHEERMRFVSGWPDGALPDFASVAFSEEGAAEAAQLVLSRGIVLESAVWSMDDVPSLLEFTDAARQRTDPHRTRDRGRAAGGRRVSRDRRGAAGRGHDLLDPVPRLRPDRVARAPRSRRGRRRGPDRVGRRDLRLGRQSCGQRGDDRRGIYDRREPPCPVTDARR